MSEPWTEFPHIWRTKAAFFSWVRGGLRRGLWERHPVKIEYLHSRRVRVPLGRKTKKNKEGLVWGLNCDQCSGLFKQHQCEVNHLNPSGSLNNLPDLTTFIIKLILVSFEDLNVLCKPCHKIQSYAERMGLTFEEAKEAKKLIAFKKLSKLDKLDELGYTSQHTATHEALNVEWLRKQVN